MKLKTNRRPMVREICSVLIGPAIWLALLLLVAGRNAYPAEPAVVPISAATASLTAPASECLEWRSAEFE